jgi:hypothetical protein
MDAPHVVDEFRTESVDLSIDSPVHGIDLLVEAVEANVHGIKTPIESVEPDIHRVEALIHAVEPDIHRVEALIHGVEPGVHDVESGVHGVEARCDFDAEFGQPAAEFSVDALEQRENLSRLWCIHDNVHCELHAAFPTRANRPELRRNPAITVARVSHALQKRQHPAPPKIAISAFTLDYASKHSRDMRGDDRTTTMPSSSGRSQQV